MEKRHGVREDDRFSYILGVYVGLNRYLKPGYTLKAGRPGTRDEHGTCSVDRWWVNDLLGLCAFFLSKEIKLVYIHQGSGLCSCLLPHPKQVKAITWTGSWCAVLDILTLNISVGASLVALTYWWSLACPHYCWSLNLCHSVEIIGHFGCALGWFRSTLS